MGALTRLHPACTQPGCGATAGDPNCYTASGFVRPPHQVRTTTRQALTPDTPPPAGRLSGRRPSDKQARILAKAETSGGLFETCEWPVSGAAATRAAVYAMAGDARGWMKEIRATADGRLYEMTSAGREALARYRAWMAGAR